MCCKVSLYFTHNLPLRNQSLKFLAPKGAVLAYFQLKHFFSNESVFDSACATACVNLDSSSITLKVI